MIRNRYWGNAIGRVEKRLLAILMIVTSKRHVLSLNKSLLSQNRAYDGVCRLSKEPSCHFAGQNRAYDCVNRLSEETEE